MSENELVFTLALQRVPNLGDASAKKLLQHIGSAEGVFKEKKQNLLKIDGIGASKIKDLSSDRFLEEAEAELSYMKANDISFSYFKDSNYPEKLKHCIDGPMLLFQKGRIDLPKRKILSIVGTRKITTYGKAFCEQLIEELAPLDPIIVSGFAYGVDIVAHKAAMEHGLQTIACLAHGFEQVYPKVHKKYIPSIEENGGFLTEFWSNDAFDRTNFLRRNRIIAGMSEATIVIESAEKGGSLVTADIANSYNREVFAVPGRTSDSQSEGCNDLIKSQQARLLTCAADIVYMLGWKLDKTPVKSVQAELFVALTDEETIVYEYLNQHEKVLLDEISQHCTMPTYKVATLLLSLELKGVVRPIPGKLFQVV
ncbi:DNA-processing protein DprA [Ulvibacter litoralis]|uniref:DNA-processing protein DprA n=1 Tax=Ulvibacter litoralis TaxID=227084 RepID=UPI000B81561F|nr:DNA-processing protein DprA [Ulvibacter litoralis]